MVQFGSVQHATVRYGTVRYGGTARYGAGGCARSSEPSRDDGSSIILVNYLFDVVPGQKQRGFHEQKALLQGEQGTFVHPVMALDEADRVQGRARTWGDRDGHSFMARRMCVRLRD